MRWGVSGKTIPYDLIFATPIQAAALLEDFPPCWLYAIGKIESIDEFGASAATIMSTNGDGGHGIFQLTSSFPDNWQDPQVSAQYAIKNFLMPAVQNCLASMYLSGDQLVRVASDVYNEGWGAEQISHSLYNDADFLTTGHDYGQRALAAYKELTA
jgi:hypothetical protein